MPFHALPRPSTTPHRRCAPHEEEWILPPFTMLTCKTVEERGEPPAVKRVLICGITVNPVALDIEEITNDFDARPRLRAAPDGADDPLLHGALFADMPPHFLCPFTNMIMTDPVYASDGHAYEREYLRRWIEERRTAGEHIISPLTHEGIDYTMREATELSAEIRSYQVTTAECLPSAR